MEGAAERSNLFEDLSVAAIPSNALSSHQCTALLGIVEALGASVVRLRNSDRHIEALESVTHIISTDIDFPQYNAAIESGVTVVKPSWVYTSQAKNKQAGARQHSPDPSQYFQDVVLTCGDLPDGDKDAIIAGVMALGGQYSGPLTKITTHIVTLDDDDDKCRMAIAKNVDCKIVLPHWFDDCLKLGKKISERLYTFPDPPYRQLRLPKPANSDAPDLEGATTAVPTGSVLRTPPPSPSDRRKNLNAFMSKKIKLSADLQLGEHLRDTLRQLINHGGGTLTENVNQADIYIGQFRDGADYVAAARARKEVASLSWLYHVINQNKYTNPLRKLMHYPVPRNGIPGFENMKISISNYNGDARTYLENLVKNCGAEFTKTMKQDNTHLITAHTRSEKCEAAQEWNIHIINHLWLEESYAKCTVQTLANPRYTHFPAGTNLSEVCGQTPLDMKKIEQVHFPPPRESPKKAVRPPDAQPKPRPSPRKTVPASNVATTPSKLVLPGAPTPLAEAAEDEQDDEEQTRHAIHLEASGLDNGTAVPDADPRTAKKPRGRPRKSLATPRTADDEKENFSPMITTSGRAAKAVGLEKTHAQALDMLQFQKECKRKGGVVYGGRRSEHSDDFVSSPSAAPASKKRKSDASDYEATAEGSELSDGETQPIKAGKKAKTAAANVSLPPVMFRMMTTGDDRWHGNLKQEDVDKTKLRMLGVEVTQDPSQVNILVAPSIKTTRKFVAAIANGPIVVDPTYLDVALNQNKLVDDPKLLQDELGETTWKFKLADGLERAKENQHRLLTGWSIFVTESIAGGFDTFKEIIIINGGDAYLYKGRTGLTLPKRRIHQHSNGDGEGSEQQEGDDEYDFVYLVSGMDKADIKLWKTFRTLAEKQGLRARIVKKEWLLSAALTQEIRWSEEWLLHEAALTDQH
ncbi:hypothetical protein BAUCODRAFT_29207 [Baudoinia panamericana UAMH 10762]|uniref:BRCT domain-containing protein n=1 Tax=Baudoinia panamericana (strain UAMH 10762) TaxID=717646 RepID=M2M1A3_BAUPA|nr:uncharacterized protein BAUCODRAFT_29207 [Baudoinia panamericana UAMH 10762]EMD00828.1 hypothetical protein BAUCODRAFT_29207 [Baudoinia panamericana UAMH 10762]